MLQNDEGTRTMNLPLELYNASLANQPGLQYRPVKNIPLSYPVQSFPPVLRNVIQSLHNNSQIPVELIGNVVLAAISLSCQSLIEVIQPHTNMAEPCSLYLMTIAESGEENNHQQTGHETVLRIRIKSYRAIRATHR